MVARCNGPVQPVCNPFGIDLEEPPLAGVPYWSVVTQDLHAPFYRPSPIFLDQGGACPNCEGAVLRGLPLVLGVRANGGPTTPTSPPADPAKYQADLGSVLDAYPGAIAAVVIEDEVDTPARWSGTVDQYLAELAAGCAAAHQRGVRCTDSGVSSTNMLFLMADYYESEGSPTLALGVLAAAGDNPEVVAAFPAWPPAGDAEVMAALAARKPALDGAKALIAGARGAGVDLADFHFFESDLDTFDLAVAYMRNRSGCNTVMTGAFGLRAEDELAASRVLSDAHEFGLGLAVWASRAGGGEALVVDASGAMMANGTAFQMVSSGAMCGD
jgi:hypothetical protein